MQPLISNEYTKPLVTIQVLFLRYVMEEHVREVCVCNGEAGKYLLPPPPAKKFSVSSLRCAWKQLLELVVGATK